MQNLNNLLINQISSNWYIRAIYVLITKHNGRIRYAFSFIYLVFHQRFFVKEFFMIFFSCFSVIFVFFIACVLQQQLLLILLHSSLFFFIVTPSHLSRYIIECFLISHQQFFSYLPFSSVNFSHFSIILIDKILLILF